MQQVFIPLLPGKCVCPQCGELATRTRRTLHDRLVSWMVPSKRYKCFVCEWSARVQVLPHQQSATPLLH